MQCSSKKQKVSGSFHILFLKSKESENFHYFDNNLTKDKDAYSSLVRHTSCLRDQNGI